MELNSIIKDRNLEIDKLKVQFRDLKLKEEKVEGFINQMGEKLKIQKYSEGSFFVPNGVDYWRKILMGSGKYFERKIKHVPVKSKSVSRKGVVIVSESQGRGVAELLNFRLSSRYRSLGFVYANAKLCDVLKNTADIMKSGGEDYIFVLGGSNDFSRASQRKVVSLLTEQYKLFIQRFSGTRNVIFSTIPYRYDLRVDSIENILIKAANKELRNVFPGKIVCS